jgi:peptidoglycan/LPS O-acetylase OafA/YrhL
VEIIALVLLPLAVAIVAYSLVVFCWRNSQIAMKQAAYIDDRRGPLLLAGLVTGALTAIFLVSCVDLWDAYEASRGKNGPLGGWQALAAANASVATPHVALPQALALPLSLVGAGGAA